MKRKLMGQAANKFLAGAIVLALLLFVPAGNLDYWQRWLFLTILLIPMLMAEIWLLVKHPDLLQKRLNAKEPQKEQSRLIRWSGLMFVLGFVLAGLNFRFQWMVLPDWVCWVGAGIFLIIYGLYAEVLQENVWLSRTVEVQKDQKVVDQ